MNEGVRKILFTNSWECTGAVGKGKENKNAMTRFVGLVACLFWISLGISTIKHCNAIFFFSFCFVLSRMTEYWRREKTGFFIYTFYRAQNNGRVTMLLEPSILFKYWDSLEHHSYLLQLRWSMILEYIYIYNEVFAPC